MRQNAVESGGEIFVLAGGFEKLKLLRFVTPVLPPLSFLEGAMPKLESLELKFIMAEAMYGMENLVSLRQVLLTVSSQAPEVAKVKVSQIKTLASKHPKHPSVVVDEYKELEEKETHFGVKLARHDLLRYMQSTLVHIHKLIVLLCPCCYFLKYAI